MKLYLAIKYTQLKDGTWQGCVLEAPHVNATGEDLESCRTMLDIFIAEEVAAMYKGERVRVEVTREEIFPLRYSQDS